MKMLRGRQSTASSERAPQIVDFVCAFRGVPRYAGPARRTCLNLPFPFVRSVGERVWGVRGVNRRPEERGRGYVPIMVQQPPVAADIIYDVSISYENRSLCYSRLTLCEAGRTLCLLF